MMGKGRESVSGLLAFTTQQVCNLTGLSPRQVRYWDDTGFFHPSIAGETRRRYGRVYSFRDLVGLRVIAVLRRQHGVTFPQLRRVAAWLAERPTESWSSLRFYVGGGDVYFDDRELGARRSARNPQQTVIPFEMEPVMAAMATEAKQLRERTWEDLGRVTRHRYVSHNAPVLAGTRIRTEAIWNFHAAGYSDDEILRQYPRLDRLDVQRAIAFERERRRIAS